MTKTKTEKNPTEELMEHAREIEEKHDHLSEEEKEELVEKMMDKARKEN